MEPAASSTMTAERTGAPAHFRLAVQAVQSFATMTASITAAAGGRTSVGKKVAVATTGLIGVGFVFAHMIGNLKVFLGPHAINTYGEGLRDMGEPYFPRSFILWTGRLVLIAAVVTHIVLTAQLAMQSRRARPVRYEYTKAVRKNPAARTMRWGAVFILLFIVFHLADLTWGTVNPGYVRGDVYRNIVATFNRPAIVVVYLAAMFSLGMHLYHGTWSVTQTLGLNQTRWDRPIRRGATALAVIIAGGFSLVPLGVLVGIVK
jgi:succinate dehydrogenase / fumarate reductase cytochrome b subunit